MKLWKEAFVTHTIDMHFGDAFDSRRPSSSTANKARLCVGLFLPVFGLGKGGGLITSDHPPPVKPPLPTENSEEPISAWFGQPGGGVQHYTKGLSNVAYLKFQEYLKEIKP
jgi:hypothetical protein